MNKQQERKFINWKNSGSLPAGVSSLAEKVVFLMESITGKRFDQKENKRTDLTHESVVTVDIKGSLYAFGSNKSADVVRIIMLAEALDLVVEIQGANIKLLRLYFYNMDPKADQLLEKKLSTYKKELDLIVKGGAGEQLPLANVRDFLNAAGFKPKGSKAKELVWCINQAGDGIFAMTNDPDVVHRLNRTEAQHRVRQLSRRARLKSAAV